MFKQSNRGGTMLIYLLSFITNTWGLKGEASNTRLVGGWFKGPDYDVYAVDTLAFVGDGECLKILNVKDPSSPFEIGKIKLPEQILGIAGSGRYVYVADFLAGLRIVDVSDPSNPQEIGYYDTPGGAYDVYVLDSIAYVADADSD